jgi:serine/threonine protein kinase
MGIEWGRLLSELPQKFGAYVLLRPLGEGGMGAVYLAMSGHRQMETLCVVKRLLPALQSDPDHIRRFRHEADLARRLVHSNLAHTHNIGEVEGEVFLVQEFVEGHDLSALIDELVKRQCKLPVGVSVYIAGELARGLSYAHDFENLNLVHRDINLPNVRLTYAGEVKLLDFGIASSDLHGEALGAEQGAGKLWHLAPEQVRPGMTVDRRADVYAVGVVLWELLTQRQVGTVLENGRERRVPETEGEVLVWITQGRHQKPSLFNPDVSPALDALVAKATHVNPDRRYANADELRHALAAFFPKGFHPEQCLSSLMKDLFLPEQERSERRVLVESGRHLLDTGSGDMLERAPSGNHAQVDQANVGEQAVGERRSGNHPLAERRKSGTQPIAERRSGNHPLAERRKSGTQPIAERAKSGTFPKLVTPTQTLKRLRRWLAPMAVGAVLGCGVLAWLVLAGKGGDVEGKGIVMPPVAATRLVDSKPTAARPASPPAAQPLSAHDPEPAPAEAPSLGTTKEQRPVVSAPKRVETSVETASAVGAMKDQRPVVTGPKRVETASETASSVGKTDHLTLARDAFNDRDWPRALSEAKNAVAAGDGAEAHALVGSTYFKMGRYDEAESAYAKAIALDPKNRLLQERLSIARARAREAKSRAEP